MKLQLHRHPGNPIVTPGKYDWRKATVFNPGIIQANGKVYLYERTAGQLRPFICYIGMMESEDGVHFRHSAKAPVFTPEMAGSVYGSVQDPRITALDGRYFMTYAYRPFAWSSHPTGVGVPESFQTEFPGFDGDPLKNQTRSGIAVSDDLYHWEHFSWATPLELDDRDVVLFPEKIKGRYAMLRRPLQYVGPAYGTDKAGIWLSYSDDLENWDSGTLVAKPEFSWECNRIGGGLPPIRTHEGWLVIYHGVETLHEADRTVIYRAGAMLLDLEDPSKVLKRSRAFIMEPEAYYERFGLYIPYVVFPTGGYVEDGWLHLYYGACDTAIGRASVRLEELLEFIDQYS
jgi:predicted GH43/DUF377 family glycosyl hydrolase